MTKPTNRSGTMRAACAAATAALLLGSCTGSPGTESSTSAPTTVPAATSTSTPAQTTTSTTTPATTTTTLAVPDEVRPLFDYLAALTSIRPHQGWRNSATSGEAEALDFVAGVLDGFSYLQSLGLELERQSFPVLLSTELRDSRLYLTVDGREVEVAADAPRGHRHDVARAPRFDSDGVLNDSQPDPATAEGEVVLIRSQEEMAGAEDAGVRDAIVFLDYELVNPMSPSGSEGPELLSRLIDGGAAGLVLVTDSAAGPGAQPGYLAGDGKVLEYVTAEASPPVLNLRLEDCAAAGLEGWEDLGRVESARLVWDADVLSPGTSENLVARIPGADTSRAVILGAHIDSANSPGGIDNGLNSALLLDLARTLDQGRVQPPVDLYLVWFGSEEIGLYGSLYFVDTHQDLLDRTLGVIGLDAIVIETPEGFVLANGWSHSRFGDDRLTFARYLEQLAVGQGISVDEVADIQGLSSDNTFFSAFVPQAGLAFGGPTGGYGHTPYDTWEAAAAQADHIGQLAELVLMAATETGRELPDLRVTPEPERRALLVGSHTQVAQMSGAMLVELAYALAWAGFDVDTIPYGRPITPEDVEDASLVVVLPMIDYAEAADGPHDDGWAPEEIEVLVDYVEEGGMLVLVNSARRVVFGQLHGPNEDWDGLNPLAERFGATYEAGTLSGAAAPVTIEHPLTQGSPILGMIVDNGVPITLTDGLVLAETRGRTAAGLIGYGGAGGEVLVLADLGMLQPVQFMPPQTDNLNFFRNLAAYAREH
jgi:hypothetical protein